MTIPQPLPRTRPLEPTGRAVASYLTQLQKGLADDVPSAVATTAQLRSAAGSQPYDEPRLWGTAMDRLFDALDAEDSARTAEPEPGAARRTTRPLTQDERHRAEHAYYLVLTLWASHQQSIRDEGMFQFGWPLGRSVRGLSTSRGPDADAAAGQPGAQENAQPVGELEPTLRKRYGRIGSAPSLDQLGLYLRGMVKLLRQHRIPVDYAHLADQLQRWQHPDLRDDVRREWGRELHTGHWRRADATSPGAADTSTADDA